jgi:DNA-directed RNA polymerase subunit beta'
MGAMGTFLVKGAEYFTPTQLRLKPGAYTRRQANDEIETFIPTRGAQLKMHMSPTTGVLKVEVYSTNVSWYGLVRALGLTDQDILTAWGNDAAAKELLEKNKVKNPDKDVEKFFTALFSKKQNRDLQRAGLGKPDEEFVATDKAGQVTAIRSWMSEHALDPYVTKHTLGQEFSSLSPEVLLQASRRILEVSRGTSEPDDRDLLAYKTVHDISDMLPERITRLGKRLQRKLLLRLGKPGSTIAKGFGSNWLDLATVGYFGGTNDIEGGLSHTAEAANPLAILSEGSKTTLVGDGGIGSDRAITMDARLFRPTSIGFIDPVHSPEGASIGVTTHTAWNTRKNGNKLEALFLKVDNGVAKTPVWISAEEANDAIVGYPEYYDIGGTGKALQKKVRANKNGDIELVDASEVQYVLPSGRSLFDHTSNAALFFDSTSANRGMMAGKHLTQALPLVHREHPLVDMTDGHGNSVLGALAKTFTIRSTVDGTVTKVTPTEIVVGDKKHELYSDFGMQSKVSLDHVPVVKVGDKVKRGDLLADSNYSRDGKLTLGVNVRTAYMPWKNASNYEDAIVISDSAAKRFTSQHTHQLILELVPGIVVDKRLAQAQFPTLFTATSFDAIDNTGVIKEGSKIVPGQIVIAAVKKVEFDPQDRTVKNLASIHKMLERPYKNVCVTWNEIFPAIAYRIIRTSTSITVHLKTEEPMQVGDKLSMSSAAKGTVSAIIPDDKMPRTKKNEHIEVILSPHGVVGRVNPSQTIEQAAGKLVKETGKPYTFANFDGTNRAKDIADKLAKAGIEHEEKLFDPETGKWLERPVAVGYNYMSKLDHPVRRRFSARERDGYTMDETPTRGKGVGAQPYDHLTTYALLGHNAHALLGESAGIRGTKNDAWWESFQAGEIPPPPKVPFIFEKFRGFLNAAGVDTTQSGNVLQYLPMSEKRVLEKSNGEITNATMIRSKDLAEEKNGLYDVGITGGLKGDKWAHIALAERIPHPLFEKSICDVTGMKRSEFYGMLSHRVYFNEATNKFQNEASHGAVTGEEGFKKVLSFDVDDKLAEVKRGLRTAVGSDANKLNRAARYLNGLKATKLSAFDAYMTKYVPVLPPQYRPIIELSGGALRVADSNLLYRDVILTNNAMKDGKLAKMPDSIQGDARVALYQSVGALVGVNNALTHRDDREDAQGFIDVIKGKTNKTGMFQRLVTSHRNDYTGRSTIEPDANIGVDEIGIPEEMAWKIYKPMIVRRLSLLGNKPKDALEAVEKRTLIARQALDDEMKNRPVLFNRAPSLHRWSISAAFPKISSGKEIRISPLITGPTGSDFDGDAVSITPPITDAALQESLKLLPSRNLIYDKDRTLAYGVSKDIISGIFALTKPGSPSGKKYATAADAIAAYHDNRDNLNMGSLVSVAGAAPVAVGWLIFQSLVPARFLAGVAPPINGKKLDALLTDIASKSPSDYSAISRRLSQAGFQYAAAAGGISSTINELNVDRTKINRLLDQMETGIDKAKGVKDKREAAIKGYADINPQLETIVKDHLKTVDRAYSSFLESGSNKKFDQMKQMIASPVLMSNVRDEVVPAVIKTSYGQGMAPSDYVLTTPGSRKGIVARSLSTALPGFLNKEISGNMASVRIYDKDCGTQRGIQEPLKAPKGLNDYDVDLLDRHLLRDIPGTIFKRNDPVTPGMLSRLRDSDVESIWVRSPMTCQSASPPCQMCAGRGANGELWPIGSNIGYNYGQAVSERSTQTVMRVFHAGGTIGAGDALMSGFARLRELLSVPDIIKKQGTLATVSGRVEGIKLAPQGGHYLTIGDTEHYIQQGRDLIVKNGDQVSSGDPLSTGNFKPQEIAEHKGLLAAQQYVVNQIRKSYQDAGAVVRKPVIEVLAAAMMRTVEITDDGGEPDLTIGNIIHENEYEERKKRNPKIKAKPMLLGLSQKPLQSQDLLERLNFQRLDDAVRDVASSGGKSDLTGSKSPIPGLAYGAAFRQEADSGFNAAVRNG